MSDDLRMLEEMTSAVFLESRERPSGDETPQPDVALWSVMEGTGLTRLTFPADQGGGEGSLSQLLAVVRLAGKFSIAVPLAESALLAGWLLGRAEIEIPVGMLTCALDTSLTLQDVGEGISVNGTGTRVAWGSSSDFVVAVSTDAARNRVVAFPSTDCEWTTSSNLAKEPREDFAVHRVLARGDVGEVGDACVEELRLRAILGRAAMMVGACERAFDLTLDHVKNRTQFGRPIGKFQSVQHDIARMASYVRSAMVAVQRATDACEESGFLSTASRIAVLSSKSEANRVGTLVARLSHQLLGAIGFTDEHELRLSTIRLWSWCQENGTSAQLHDELGQAVLGADSAWHFITPSVSHSETAA